MQTREPRVRLSLPVVLTVLIVFFVGSTGIMTTVIAFRGSSSIIAALISDIMEDSRSRILEDTLDYVFAGSDALQFLADLVTESDVAAEFGRAQAGGAAGVQAVPQTPSRPPLAAALTGFLGEFLEDNPQFLSASFTAVNGAHVRAIRMTDGSISFLTQSVIGNEVLSSFEHANPEYAAQFPPVQRLPREAAYNPRGTEWFREAAVSGGLIWTDVRVLDTMPLAGLTSAVPITQNSQVVTVVSLDISLAEISRFLGTAPALEAQSFIADPESGTMVAFPESILPQGAESDSDGDRFIVEEGDSSRLVTVADLQDTLLSVALADLRARATELAEAGSAESSFEFDGNGYLSSFSTFPQETGWNWVIGIAVPEEVFLDPILESIRVTVLISAGVVLLGIFMGFRVSRRISRPLQQLSADMQQIKAFELDQSAPIQSRFREVIDMSNSLDAMKAGLRSFRKYVPAGLVRQLIDMGREAELGGEQKRLTVLFSDIAGFSGIAEVLSPADLVVRLAEYLGALSDVIERGHGTVDKYIGDAIMAFWGAPAELDQPELAAVEAALECQAVARQINQKWRSEGLDISFHVRVGINTGDLIVGNMGSDSRLNYTVIGDAVNLASRLEGANKQYHTDIMISQTTYEAVSDTIACRIIDRVQVKGRTEAIMVYEPLGRHAAMGKRDAALIALHNEAWHLYADSRFREAAVRFKKIYKEDSANSLAALYFNRCAALIKKPPGPDWVAENRLQTK